MASFWRPISGIDPDGKVERFYWRFLSKSEVSTWWIIRFEYRCAQAWIKRTSDLVSTSPEQIFCAIAEILSLIVKPMSRLFSPRFYRVFSTISRFIASAIFLPSDARIAGVTGLLYFSRILFNFGCTNVAS
jgi:hypothetical protein